MKKSLLIAAAALVAVSVTIKTINAAPRTTGEDLIWTGVNDSPTGAVWGRTVAGVGNWTNGVSGAGFVTTFLDGDAVTFDSTDNTPGGIIKVRNAVAVSSMTVSGGKDYTFKKSGITSTGALTKSDDGVLTLNNSNEFGGGVILEGGTIVLGSNKALGTYDALSSSTQGEVTVTGEATVATGVNRTITNRFVVDGGALTLNIASGKTLTISGVIRDGGSVTNGGAIDFENGSLAIAGGGSLVLKDNTGIYGGGIEGGANDIDLSGLASFTAIRNTADYGGALDTVGSIVLGDSVTFTNNTSGEEGGAIWADRDVTIGTGAKFTTNTAGGNGGAIYAGGDIELGDGATFTTNTADYNGGAIYSADGSVTLGSGAIFTGNKAGDVTSGITGEGGAIKAENSITIGTDAKMRNNEAAFGGALFAWSGDVTIDSNATFTTNTADYDGGAIYAGNGSVTIGTGAKFTTNTAGGNGGAIWAGNSVNISSGTTFIKNQAGNVGGAIYVDNGAANLNADTGDILFRGNSDSNGSNSIYLANDAALNITGADNVYFDDPVNANGLSDLTKNGTGTVQFKGDNYLDGDIAINEGGFRLAGVGAQITGNSFTLASGTMLGGRGAITAGTITLSGTIAPDKAVLSTGNTNTVTGANNIGLLKLFGNVEFSGATFQIDLAPTAAQTSDRIAITGDVIFSTASLFKLNNWENGKFTIATATGGMTGSDPTYFSVKYNDIEYNLNNYNYAEDTRRAARLNVTAGGKLNLILTDDNNTTVYWTGAIDSAWQGTDFSGTGNWDNGNTTDTTTIFLNGDKVVFDSTDSTGHRDIAVTGNVIVASMLVDGDGDYTFSGSGGITATTNQNKTTLKSPTGRLEKYGSGVLTLNNANKFEGGIILEDGTIVIGHNKALGTYTGGSAGIVYVIDDATVANAGNRKITNRFESYAELTLDIAAGTTLTISDVHYSDIFTYGGAIDLTYGTLKITGGGSLVLKNNTGLYGGAMYAGDDVTLGSKATFSDNQATAGDGGAIFSGGSVTLGNKATFSGNQTLAAGDGGAIYAIGDVGIGSNAEFSLNKAGSRGGAILAGGTVMIGNKATFSENEALAGNGGAVNANGNVGIDNNAGFIDNKAAFHGGAIYSGGGNVTLGSGATFSGNRAGVASAGTGGAIYAGDSVMIGNKATFSDNRALTGDGGAIYAGDSVMIGNKATFSDNSATNLGGAIRAGSVTIGNNATFSGNNNSTGSYGGGAIMVSRDASIGNNAMFSDNTAGAGGGAIFSENGTVELGSGARMINNSAIKGSGGAIDAKNVTISGDTVFSGNTAAGNGGAIRVYGGVANLNADGGDILFQGNTDSNGSNSIYLSNDAALNISGANNVYFDDPVNASGTGDLTKTGTGIVQFKGANTLGGDIAINEGGFRLAGVGASITGNSFTLATGTMLGGRGTITAGSITLSGTIAPDKEVFSTGYPVTDLNSIGLLKLVGNVEFSGATFQIDLAPTAAQTSDRIAITGDVTFDTASLFKLNNWENGKYTIASATGIVSGDPTTLAVMWKGRDRNVNSATFPSNIRTGALLELTQANKLNLTVSDDNNVRLTWTGSANSIWHGTNTGQPDGTGNWTNSGTGSELATTFLDGDAVIFDTNTDKINALNRNIFVGANVIVESMIVDGSGSYTFSGSGITATTNPKKTTLHSLAGSLTKSGTGTLTLNNANEFQGGIELIKGTIILGNDKALGTYTGGTQGEVTVSGKATVQTLEDRSIKNRFVATGGKQQPFTLEIASGKTLIIHGAETADNGGAINFEAGKLVIAAGSGSLVLKNNKADNYGGAIEGGGNDINLLGLASLIATGNAAQFGGALDTDGSVLLGNDVTFTGNTASYAGGAIYAGGDVKIGSGAKFNGTNYTDGSGGAIYAEGSVSISGDTVFRNNSAAGNGGAIYVGSGAANLNTDAGDILFRGNSAGANANSIYLANGASLNISGANNVYFDDSVNSGGSSNLTKTGGGILQLQGDNYLGGVIDAKAGQFRLAGTDAKISGSDFILRNNATLGGSGTITADTIDIRGTVDLDNRVFTPNNIAPAGGIGKLTLVGATTFTGATLKIDLDNTALPPNDLIDAAGYTVTFAGNNNKLVIGSFETGHYTLVTADSITYYNAKTLENKMTIGGLSLADINNTRQTAVLTQKTDSLVLDLEAQGQNVVLTWTGAVDAVWDGRSSPDSGNWTNKNSVTPLSTFLNGDAVYFDTTTDAGKPANRTITIGGNRVKVASMTVSGSGDYTFSGGRIIADGTTSTLDSSENTGKLTKKGSGILTLNNSNEFLGGIELKAGTIVLGHNKALGTYTGAPGAGEVTVTGKATVATLTAGNRSIENHFVVEANHAFTLESATGAALTLGSSASGEAINLATGATLKLAADGDMFFNASINGATDGTNTLTKTGTGIVQFGAAMNSIGGDVIVKNGQLRLAGATVVAGTTVEIAKNATLAGSGTIATGGGTGNFDITGTVSPDSAVLKYGKPDVGNARTGKLTLGGDATFTKATLAIDLAAHGDSDLIEVSGKAEFTGGLVDVSEFRKGEYVIVTGAVLSGWETLKLSIAGDTYPEIAATKNIRESAKLDGSDTVNLKLNIKDDNSVVLWWTGAGGNVWNTTQADWTNKVSGIHNVDTYAKGDIVRFDGTADSAHSGNRTIEVAGNVGVAAMFVEGNEDYAFDGPGSIKVDSALWKYGAENNQPLANGKLTKTGSGTLTLNTANQFVGGIELNKGTIILGNDKALGTYAVVDGTQGEVTVTGDATVKTLADRSIKNRFVATGNKTLTLAIASGTTLVIHGAETTGIGGAINFEAGKLAIAAGSGSLELRNNTGTGWGGGAIEAGDNGLDLTNLESLKAVGNTGEWGGVIDANGKIALGENATFRNNTATSGGGAIYAGSDITISGNTVFSNNTALSDNGGAIYVYGGTANLNATGGDITFTSDNTANGASNSIYFENDSNLNISGGKNVYIDAPVTSGGSTTFTKTGAGIAQFQGDNGFGGDADIKAGVIRLAGGASIDVANFTLRQNATLSGSGTIDATGAVVLAGTVSLDTETFSSGHTNGNAANVIGSLQINGDTQFKGTTLAVDLNPTGADNADRINVSGDVTFTGQGIVTTDNLVAGVHSYILVESTGAMDVPNKQHVVRVNNDDLSTFSNIREFAEAVVVGSQLLLNTTTLNNVVLTWTAAKNNNWNFTGPNWTNGVTGIHNVDTFINGDVVVFENTPGEKVNKVNIRTDILPAEIRVTSDNDYVFQGTGSITLNNTPKDYVAGIGNTTLTATGKLHKDGAGKLTIKNGKFTNKNIFTNGFDIKAGTVSLAYIYDTRLDFDVTGKAAGTLEKAGDGTLTLVTDLGTNGFNGTLHVANGVLSLANNQTVKLVTGGNNGIIQLNGNTLTTDGNRSGKFSGQMLGSGTFIKDGTRAYTLDGAVNGRDVLAGNIHVAAGVLRLRNITGCDLSAPAKNITLAGGWLDLSDLKTWGDIEGSQDWCGLNLIDGHAATGGVIGKYDRVVIYNDASYKIGTDKPGVYVVIDANSSFNDAAACANGAGKVCLTGENVYVGSTHLASGTLMLSKNTQIGEESYAREVVFTGGNMCVTASVDTLGRALEMRTDGAIDVVAGATTTWSTVTNGGLLGGTDATLTKTGTGALVLTDVVEHTGTINVDTGLVQFLDTATLGALVVGIDGTADLEKAGNVLTDATIAGVANINGNTAVVNPIDVASTATVTLGNNVVLTLQNGGTILSDVYGTAGTLYNQGGTLAMTGNLEGDFVNDAVANITGNIGGNATNSGTLTQTGSITGSLNNDDIAAFADITGNVGAVAQNLGTAKITGDVITNANNAGRLTVTGDIGGSLANIDADSVATIGGNVGEAVENLGTAKIGGNVGTNATNAGTLTVTGSVFGNLANIATAAVATIGTDVGNVVENLGTVIVDRNVLGNANNAGRLTVSGNINGNATNSGLLSVAGNVAGSLDNNGTAAVADIAGNLGTLAGNTGGKVTVGGNILNNANNSGLLAVAGTITGTLTNNVGGIVTKVGAVVGEIRNYGTIDSIGSVTGDVYNYTGATYNLPGSMKPYTYTINGNLFNSGTVYFDKMGQTLRVNALGNATAGEAGYYNLEIDLKAPASSDHIEVAAGGAITGKHIFVIRTIANPEYAKPKMEIPLIIGGDLQTTDIFAESETGPYVDAGLYRYTIKLDASATVVLAATQYSAAGQAIANTAGAMSIGWFAQLDNLTKRMGELRLANGYDCNGPQPARNTDFWVRGYGQQVNADLGITGMNGFREYDYGADVGADRGFVLDEKSTLYVGAFVGYQGAKRRFHDGFGSDGTTDSVYAGLYATYLHECGFYVDAVAKGQYFDSSYTLPSDKGKTENYGAGVSLEIGKQWESQQGWFVEPSAQVAYTHIFSETYDTNAGVHVNGGDSDIWRFRGMVRAGKTFELGNTGKIQPYAKIGVEEQISDGGAVRATVEGLSQRFTPNTDGTRMIYGAGVMWQLDAAQQIHVDYEGSFGDKYDMPWSVNAGYRVSW